MNRLGGRGRDRDDDAPQLEHDVAQFGRKVRRKLRQIEFNVARGLHMKATLQNRRTGIPGVALSRIPMRDYGF